VILEEVVDAAKNLHFDNRLVLFIEEGSKAIWPRSFRGTQTGEGLNHLLFKWKSTQEKVVFSSDNKSKKVEHLIINGGIRGGEQLGEMRHKISSNFRSGKNPSTFLSFQKINSI
jgi:hypothetical protein